MQLPPKIGNCKSFASFCLAKNRQSDNRTQTIRTLLLIQLLIWWQISPLRINLRQPLFLASNAAGCNKRKSVTKVSSLVYTYSISKTVGIFTDNKDSITAVFTEEMEKTSTFCFWFQKGDLFYLLDKILFVHNIHAEILKALSMQVEVSSNKYHLLWGSLISFHMERIHIKLTRYQRKIDNIFHKRNIQLNLMGNIKL